MTGFAAEDLDRCDADDWSTWPSVRETATLLGVSESTVRYWCKDPQFECHKETSGRGAIFVHPDEVRRKMREREQRERRAQGVTWLRPVPDADGGPGEDPDGSGALVVENERLRAELAAVRRELEEARARCDELARLHERAVAAYRAGADAVADAHEQARNATLGRLRDRD